MTTRNDGPYSPSDPNEPCYDVQPGGYAQQQSHHKNQNEHPVAQEMGTSVATPAKNPYSQAYVLYLQPSRRTYSQSSEETVNMDDTLNDKIDTHGKTNPEDPELTGFGFSEDSIRRGFLRKVYLILSVQLLVTAGIISIFVFYKPAAGLARTNAWIYIIVFVILIFAAIVCFGELRRKAPLNYILLGLFTVAESLMLGLISVKYRGDIVLMAMGMTALLCLGLTLFAFQTKVDFTLCGGILFIAFILLVCFGITAPLLYVYGEKRQILHLLYASVGAILCFIYFISDTQIMMAGNHKYALSPEEYIFAALNLYVDIIYIFLYLLRILRYLDFLS